MNLTELKTLAKQVSYGDGWIYAIREEVSVHELKKARWRSPTKIGWTTKPDAAERLRDLQCGNSRTLELVAVIPGGLALEAGIHRYFNTLEAVDHIRGEWFLVDRERVLTLFEKIRNSQAV